jgi:molybdate-binding protein
MKLKELREQLSSLLEEAAAKARRDARSGSGTDLSSILDGKMDVDSDDIQMLDQESVKEAIEVINRATRTKEGARRILAAVTVAIKYAGKAL